MNWKQFISSHQQLFSQWLLILLSCLVCFLYFNQYWLTAGEKLQQQSLTALADQLANESYVPLSSGNRVSLNVLVAQLEAQPQVAGVRIERLDGSVLSRAGTEQPSGVHAISAIDDGNQWVIGKVVVSGQQLDDILFWPFGLLVLLLLAASFVLHAIRHQLLPWSQKVVQWRSALALKLADLPEKQLVESPVTRLPLLAYQLHLQALEYQYLQQRLTQSALDQVVADYAGLFGRIAKIYGLEVGIDAARMEATLQHREAGEGLFLLSCAACLFRTCSQQLSENRRQRGDVCLTFSIIVAEQQAPLISTDQAEISLLASLLPEELTSRVSYRRKDVTATELADDNWQLIIVDGLIERYQKLINAQALSVNENS